MIAYLAANNLPSSAAALRAELNLGEHVFDAATAKKYETLLEKKWTSVVRLQKKVCPSLTHSSPSLSLPPYLSPLSVSHSNTPRSWTSNPETPPSNLNSTT